MSYSRAADAALSLKGKKMIFHGECLANTHSDSNFWNLAIDTIDEMSATVIGMYAKSDTDYYFMWTDEISVKQTLYAGLIHFDPDTSNCDPAAGTFKTPLKITYKSVDSVCTPD